MGVYSSTTANAYADKIKAVYECLGEIRKVADRLTPVEDLTSFQTQIAALHAQLDLLVEASNVIVGATPTGEAVLTGTVASIKTLLEIGVIPDDVVRRPELDAAIAGLQAALATDIAGLGDQITTIDLEFNDWTQFVQAQQTQIDGLQITTENLVTGQATNQTNLETAVSRLTLVETNQVAVDQRLDSIDQSMSSALTGLQGTNDIVAGHTASLTTLYNTTNLHTASIDSLNSELVNVNTNITANTSALTELETTIEGIGEDIVAQSALTTALKSVIGGSGNQMPNADFGVGANGWEITVAEEDWAGTVLTVDTFNMPVEVHCLEVLGTPTPLGQIVVQSPRVLIEAGEYYIVSGYPCVDNGTIELSYKAFNNAGAVLDQGACPPTFNVTTNTNFSDYTRTWTKFLAPVGATSLRLYLTVTGDGDFITQGALFRPMVEKAWVDQVGPSAWTPNVSGVPEALAEAVQTLETEVASIDGELTALASAQTALDARVGTAEAALINEMITSANKNAALVATTNSLSASLANVESDLAAQGSAVSTLQTQMTAAEGTISSHSSSLTNLQAQVDAMDLDTGGFGSAISALDVRVTATEDTIDSHSSAITALESSVTSANKIFAQASPPATAGRIDGDLWFDTDDGNKPYVLQGGSWVARQDLGKNTIFCQATQPTAKAVNDLWIETDNSNKMWRWNGTTWVDVADTRITSTATAVTSLTTRVTEAEGDISAQASSLTTLSTTVGNHTATISTHATSINGLNARWGVKLDVNGYVSGITSVNNGDTAEFVIAADKFRIVSAGQSPRQLFAIDSGGKSNIFSDMYLGNGRIIIDTGTYMKVQGIGFGVGNEFIEWFGPKMAITACARGNAISYMTKYGDAYFGGSLTAGILKNAVSSSSIVGIGNEVINGPFNTNGNVKTVVVSYSRTWGRTYNGFSSAGYQAGAGSNTAVIQIYRKIGTAAETLWYTLNVGGNTDIINEFDGPDFASLNWNGSVTLSDTHASVEDRTYRAVITGFTTQSVTRSDGNGDSAQTTTARLSIISTEE